MVYRRTQKVPIVFLLLSGNAYTLPLSTMCKSQILSFFSFAGDTWLRVYHNSEILPPSTVETIQSALTIVDTEVEQTTSRVIEAVFADNPTNAP